MMILQLGGRLSGYSVEDYLCSEEIGLAKEVMDFDFTYLLPLTAYARAFMRSNVERLPAVTDLISGLYGFNQSPALRKWAVEKALVGILFEGHDSRTDYVLRLLRNLGKSEKEILLWDTALRIVGQGSLSALRWTLEKGFLDLFGVEMKDTLIRLFRAKCYLDRSYEKEAEQELRKTLRATAKVHDNLLIALRNKLIHFVKLEDKIPMIVDQSPINDTNEDLLLHTVGYAFFDYND